MLAEQTLTYAGMAIELIADSFLKCFELCATN